MRREGAAFLGRLRARRLVAPLGRDATELAVSAIPLGGYVKMLDEREGRGRCRAICIARSIARTSASGSPSSPRVRSRTCCSRCCCSPARSCFGIPGQRALLTDPPASTPAAAAGIRDGDLVVAVDGEPVRSWQDLRWRLLSASGSSTATIEVERPDGARISRKLSLASVSGTDWEGNFMSMLGLRADLGVPLIDEVVADKPAAHAGLEKGDRIVAIDGMPVRSPAEVAAKTNAKPGAEVTFRIVREGVERDVT